MMMTAAYEPTVAPPRPGVAGWLDRLARVRLSINQLLFHLGVAGVFFKAGLIKASSRESTVALFRDGYRVPIFPPEVAAGSLPHASSPAPRCSSSGSARAWPPFRPSA
jgi:hypothetical protein